MAHLRALFFKLFKPLVFVSRCSKELNQWEQLTEYGQSKGHSNPYLMLECAWRVPNWAAMKEALVQVRSVQPQCEKYIIYGFSTHVNRHPHTFTHIL